MPTHSDPDVLYLRRALRDLVALSGVPMVWVGREPPAIVADFADLLVASLHMDSAFVRLRDANGSNAVEIARGKPWPAFLEWLQPHLAEGGCLLRSQSVPGIHNGARAGRGIVVPIGVNAEAGLFAAASDRPDFPGELDQLLLSVAANHAATAFRMARLVEDHRRAEVALRNSEQQLRQARDELETRVAERTAELRRSEAYLVESQRLSHTGTWVFDVTTKRHLYWSDETYRIWGLDPLAGLPSRETVWQRIHPDDRERVWEETQEALGQKKKYAGEFRIVFPDGAIRYLASASHNLFSASGEVVEIIGTHVDVTERKRAEEEHERLHRLESDLAHMNRLGIMGEQAASLVHEITQPIASARNNARAALNFLDRQPRRLDAVKEALEQIVANADRAGANIDRIRNHLKKTPPRIDRLDLNQAINEVIALAGSAITKHGVSVRTRFAEELSFVEGDRVQLQQVMLNLVLNAVEAMGSIDEGVRELSINTTRGPKDLVVGVHDTGPGIEGENFERIFEAFYTTKSGGMGMGLSICRSIIEAHGGRLWAEVNAPRGALFKFTLPSDGSKP